MSESNEKLVSKPDGSQQLPDQVGAKMEPGWSPTRADLYTWSLQETVRNLTLDVTALTELVCTLSGKKSLAKVIQDARRGGDRQALADSEASRAAIQHDLNELRADYDQLARVALPALRLWVEAYYLKSPEQVTEEDVQQLAEVNARIAQLESRGF